MLIKINAIVREEKFEDVKEALNKIEIYGHRGIEESQNKSFSANWRKK